MLVKMKEHFDKLARQDGGKDGEYGDHVLLINDISAIEKVEDYLVAGCEERDIDISHDTMAEEPLAFKSLGYGYCAGAILIYPQSTAAQNAYLFEALRKSTKNIDYSELFSKPVDKYQSKKKFHIKKIDKLVVLPGSNIMRRIVDRNILSRLAKQRAYVKIHPVTNKEDMREIKRLFKDRVIGIDYGLYDVFNIAENIYNTTSSETAIFAAMNNKGLHSIEEDGHTFRGAFSPLINNLYWAETKEEKKQVFNTLCNSDITNIFHPEDDYKTKIDNFLNTVGKRCRGTFSHSWS
jgi:hypothetical protein